jgi:AAA domain, putative AbiEii toxin, Type IV TA system
MDNEDLDFLRNNIDQLSMVLLRAQTLGNGADNNSLAFTQFLSTSQGQGALASVRAVVAGKVNEFSSTAAFDLNLTFDAATRSMRGADIIAQSAIALLDRQLPAHLTYFSLFPADRALPQGEQPIQLGSADVQQQILSHLASPGLKYNRIKQVLLQTLLQTDAGREKVISEVDLIFDQLLPGKKFAGVRISNIGFLAVQVQDTVTGRIFDMDFMSSGEKGLLLTFLFIRLTVARGGIVLLDEPELHLNSAVQERIINFIDRFCVQEMGIQVFICTHSPEVVREAFARQDCSLFHLRSGHDLTPVLPEDYTELFDIVSRLGNTTADVLFNRGNLYVEGTDDAEIIKAGFPELTNGYKISDLGGRGDVEREAPALKKQEELGKLKKPQIFVLDNDGRNFAFENGQFVKVIQWSKYCIENYLLNEIVLYNLVAQTSRENPGSRGEFANILRELALS